MAGKKARLTKKAVHGLHLGERFLRGDIIWKVVKVNSQTEVTVVESHWIVYIGWAIAAFSGSVWRKVKAFFDDKDKGVNTISA